MSRRLVFCGIVVLSVLALFAASPTSAQGDCQTFPETGKTVCGRFLQYWQSHGGLAQQGYPISPTLGETSDTDGKTYTVQYFERAVFEYHPENGIPNDILLSLLGNFAYNQNYPSGATGQTVNSSAGTRLFAETGKHLGGAFLQYWNSHDSLAQQGYPISEEFVESSPLDGKPYSVQYFERAVFELHPENAPPNNVLLSQLGTFRFQAKYSSAAALPPPPAGVPPAAPGSGSSGGQPPQAGTPPSDVKAFASYIVTRYPRVGNHALQIENTFAEDLAGIKAVSFDLALPSIDFMLHQASHADAQVWGDAVMAEAKRAWQTGNFSVELQWSGYTDDPCFDCSDECHYQSDDYTSRRGWYYSYTFVRARRYIDVDGEKIINCVR
jgi:hypothetical protein